MFDNVTDREWGPTSDALDETVNVAGESPAETDPNAGLE